MKKKFIFSSVCATTFTVGLAIGPKATVAATEQSLGGGAEERQAEITEVIVTAQRRSERLEDIPMSIVPISSESMEKAGVSGLMDLGSLASGVQINFGGNSTQPAIRGITTITTGNGVENNVGIYVDGFYETSNSAINTELLDVTSVEILKGPQGTLYGRNATGGAILINTRGPSRELTGRAQLKYGNFGERTASGFLSGPISDRIRWSVSGFYLESDGWIKLISPTEVGKTIGDAAPIEQQGARVKLEFDLTDSVKTTLGYNYSYTDDPRSILFSTFDHVLPTLPQPPARITEFGTAASNYRSKQATETNQVNLKIDANTPVGRLQSFTAFGDYKDDALMDFDGTYADLSSLKTDFSLETFQQALDLTMDKVDGLTLVLGGLYYTDKFDGGSPGGTTVRGVNGALLVKNMPVLETDSWAAYVDATYEITDRLVFNAGGRYSRDEKTFTFSTQAASGAFILPETTKEEAFDAFTPRASIRYELAPRTNIYASWSEGYRSGSFNPSGAATAALLLPIKPEEITAYEVGIKSAQSDFRISFAGFYYDYTDINVSITVPNPTCPAGQNCPSVNIFGNAPGAEVYGVDADFNWQPIQALNLRFGAAWLHARYDDFPNATGTGLNALTNLNITGQVQDWGGQQMARAPDLSMNGGFDYTVKLGDSDLVFSSNLTYSDSYVLANASLFGPAAGSLANEQRYRQDSTFLVNAQINWTDPTSHYSIGVYGKNLTDVDYRDLYSGSAFGDYGAQARPRTYGVMLAYTF